MRGTGDLSLDCRPARSPLSSVVTLKLLIIMLRLLTVRRWWVTVSPLKRRWRVDANLNTARMLVDLGRRIAMC